MPPSKAPPRGLLRGILPSRAFLDRLSDTVTPTPAALRFAKQHDMRIVLACLFASFLFIGAGIQYVVRDPTNPGVWIVLYFWTLPLSLTCYWYLYATDLRPATKARPAFAFMLAALLVSVFSLALTLAIPQIQGFLTHVIWDTFVALFWLISLLLADLAFQRQGSRLLWRKLKSGFSTGPGGSKRG